MQNAEIYFHFPPAGYGVVEACVHLPGCSLSRLATVNCAARDSNINRRIGMILLSQILFVPSIMSMRTSYKPITPALQRPARVDHGAPNIVPCPNLYITTQSPSLSFTADRLTLSFFFALPPAFSACILSTAFGKP